MSEEVRISGLRELRSGLRGMDRRLPRGIRVAGNKAADIIVQTAKPRVPLGPSAGGHAKDSIRKASTATAVRVSEGGPRFPYMPWLDFGGTINKHTQHPNRRYFYSDGRYIWSAFHERKQEILDTYQDELAQLARDSGLDVT